MTIALDTFAAFLVVLADGLDDDGLDGAEVADRLHVSRFHLDRIVSSVAGEPPQALRRRVLLERAAYRLISTDRTVLDVATEAGYSSNEAFTRAFGRRSGQRRRGGGGPPRRSRWRRATACTSTRPAACGCPHTIR